MLPWSIGLVLVASLTCLSMVGISGSKDNFGLLNDQMFLVTYCAGVESGAFFVLVIFIERFIHLLLGFVMQTVVFGALAVRIIVWTCYNTWQIQRASHS
jgi:hypothetical protein